MEISSFVKFARPPPQKSFKAKINQNQSGPSPVSRNQLLVNLDRNGDIIHLARFSPPLLFSFSFFPFFLKILSKSADYQRHKATEIKFPRTPYGYLYTPSIQNRITEGEEAEVSVRIESKGV